MNTKKAGLFVLVSILLGVLGAITTFQSLAAAPCNVSGLISTDTTWSPGECDYYVVTGNILVQAGTSLTIEPGSVIRFTHLKAITVQGKLVAIGTAVNPIVFSSHLTTPEKGDWGYILFTDTSIDNLTCAEDGSGSIVKYAILQYGGGANTSENGVLRAVSSIPCFTYNTIRNNNADGIHVWNSPQPMKITRNVIYENGDGSQSSEAGGIYYTSDSTNTHEIVANNVFSNTGTGIEVVVKGTARIVNNNISYNQSGLVVTVTNDTAISAIYSNTVVGNFGPGVHSSSYSSFIEDNRISLNLDTGLNIVGHYVSAVANEISGNMTQNMGGGIRLETGVPIGYMGLISNTITGNTADTGGGIAISHTRGERPEPVTIANNIISDNQAESGGGITSKRVSLVITNNTISNNFASSQSGGGIYLETGEFTIESNAITNNSAALSGGGLVIYSLGSGSSVSNNLFSGNYATKQGGGFALHGGASITNNVFEGNSTRGDGGAFYQVTDDTTLISENVIKNNIANGLESKGGGIFLCEGCHPALNNNDICLNNDAYDGDLYNANGSGTQDVDALENYWGVIEAAEIEAKIWHFLDDSAKGIVNYMPFRIEPVSGEPDICQPVVSPSCNLKVDLDYDGAQLLLHYDMYTGDVPVQWRNYSYLEGDLELLWSQNLPAQLTYQDTIPIPFPNSGLVTISTEFWTNQGMICSDAKSIITRSAQ